MAQTSTSSNLYNLLTSRNIDADILDTKTGKQPVDPQTGQLDMDAAELFVFNWKGPSGRDYGTAEILIDQEGNLNLYYGDNLGRGMEEEDKDDWFAFLHQLKQFAVKNFLSFSPQNINRLKFALANMSSLKEGLFEGYYGSRNMSYMGEQKSARLVIKHNRNLGENDARYRYVESLFIETSDHERFKLPFRHLGGGRAMLEHVRQGGRPYDVRGTHISSLVENLSLLARFRRANQGRVLEGVAGVLVEQGEQFYKTIKQDLKQLQSLRGYSNYFENWQPMSLQPQDHLVEQMRELFVTHSIDQRIEQALPLLTQLHQHAMPIQEAEIFETWAQRMVEGTWALPDTEESKQILVTMLSQETLPVGADAESVTSQLHDVFGDDELFDRLQTLAQADPSADARPLIIERLQELSSDPEIADVLAQVLPTQPPEQPVAPVTAAQPPVSEDNIDITNPKEKGAKINPAYVSSAAKAAFDRPEAKATRAAIKMAPDPAQVKSVSEPVELKFEEIEQFKSLLSRLKG
jgi:hypothetical protein